MSTTLSRRSRVTHRSINRTLIALTLSFISLLKIHRKRTFRANVGYISCRLARTVSLKLPSPVISLPSYVLSTGSESLNASNTSSSLLPTKLTQLPNLHTFITSSPFNVLAVLALHPSLLLLGHLHYLTFSKITDRSFHYASPCLWNQHPLSLRKPHSGTSSSISCSPIPSPIISSTYDSPLCTSINFISLSLPA